MRFKLRFVQRYKMDKEKEFMDLEKQFAKLEQSVPEFPKRKRCTV